jgi:tRNA(Arg) A34 adenosine deaminase TadA
MAIEKEYRKVISMDPKHKAFIQRAVAVAERSINEGGGPFGAVIVKEGEIIAEAANRVTLQHDPTAHAEVVAIRKTASRLGSHDLSGCVLYATCEPCPMCMGAIYWARIGEVYFASGREEAASAGFDDDHIYKELDKPIEKRSIKMAQVETNEATNLFRMWNDKPDKQPY